MNAVINYLDEHEAEVRQTIDGYVLGNLLREVGNGLDVPDSSGYVWLDRMIAEGVWEDDEENDDLFWDAFDEWYGAHGIQEGWVRGLMDEGYSEEDARMLCN